MIFLKNIKSNKETTIENNIIEIKKYVWNLLIISNLYRERYIIKLIKDDIVNFIK